MTCSNRLWNAASLLILLATLSCTTADTEGKDCIARCPRCHRRANVHQHTVLQKGQEQTDSELVRAIERTEACIETG
ncbi:MAG: hypothetical protein EFT35_05285 [Methanophagales archaeon ANME-1-THS]|nr:MAG: hypothetical protein EFT35_05285 [Methanophagales archaeon ANME-1-THS]